MHLHRVGCCDSYLIGFSGVCKLLDKISCVVQNCVLDGIIPNKFGIVSVGEDPGIFAALLVREEVLKPHRTGFPIPPRSECMPTNTSNCDNA